MRSFLFAAVFILVAGCTGSRWQEIGALGINGSTTAFSQFETTSGGTLLIAGEEYRSGGLIDKEFDKSRAVVYRSTNSAQTWEASYLQNGNIVDLDANETTCVVATSVFGDTANRNSFFISVDDGRSWRLHSTKRDCIIRDVFICGHELYTIERHPAESSWALTKSRLDTVKWVRVGKGYAIVSSRPVISREKLYFTSRATKNDRLWQVDLRTGQQEEIETGDDRFRPEVVTAFKDDLYVAGAYEAGIRIYKVAGKKSVKMITAIDDVGRYTYVMDFNISDSCVMVLLGERNTIGTTYSLQWQKSGMKSFTSASVPSAVFQPFLFTQNSLLGYTINSRFIQFKVPGLP